MSVVAKGPKSGQGQHRGAIMLVVGWLAACIPGGALAGVALTLSFVGWLFLFGVAVGISQAVFVGWWWRQQLGAWLAWFGGSAGGWIIGAFIGSAFASAGVLFDALPWAVLSLGQLLVLAGLLGRGNMVLRAVVLAIWVAVSTVGGALALTAGTWIQTTGFYPGLEQAIGGTPAVIVSMAVLTPVLYGIPTAAVLAGATRSA